MRLTTKQLEILQVINTGTPDGPCSVYEILDGIAYECKRDAMLHSIKILVEKGLVERLNPPVFTNQKQYFQLSKLGKELLG